MQRCLHVKSVIYCCNNNNNNVYGTCFVSFFIISFFFSFFFVSRCYKYLGFPGQSVLRRHLLPGGSDLSLEHRFYLCPRQKLLPHRKQRSLILRASRHGNINHTLSPPGHQLNIARYHAHFLRERIFVQTAFRWRSQHQAKASTGEHASESISCPALDTLQYWMIEKYSTIRKLPKKIRPTRPSRPVSVVAAGYRFYWQFDGHNFQLDYISQM